MTLFEKQFIIVYYKIDLNQPSIYDIDLFSPNLLLTVITESFPVNKNFD